jgi:hypothetical protein
MVRIMSVLMVHVLARRSIYCDLGLLDRGGLLHCQMLLMFFHIDTIELAIAAFLGCQRASNYKQFGYTR